MTSRPLRLTLAPPSPLLMIKALTALLVCASASLAVAQDTETVTDTLTSITLSPSDEALNLSTCESVAAETEFTLSGQYNQPSATVAYNVRLIATTGSSCSHEDVCNSTPLDEGGCSCLREVSGTGSISTNFKVGDLFDEVCVEGEERVVSFFLHYTEEETDPLLLNSTPIEEESQAVKLNIDLKAPTAPSEAPSISAAEEALRVTVSEVGGDASDYEVCVRESGSTEPFTRCKAVTPEASFRFEGLLNDVTYEVVYAAYDEAGNRSDESPIAEGTPASVLDFAEVYSDQYGGGEMGGCESTPGRAPLGLPLSFALLALALSTALNIRRRHRLLNTLLALSLTAGITSAPLSAHADVFSTEQSEHTTTVSFMAGSYLPALDSEFQEREGFTRPYERVFQNDAPLMFWVSADRHLIQNYGTLSLGGSAGYWNVEGEAISEDAAVSESTEMSIYPLALSLNYRFDRFQDSFPLVPVVKAGLTYYLWTVYNGAGEAARFASGDEASGGTLGWSYTVGLHFLLDSLDREMAWAFDRDAGVNHSYLSVEYQVSQVDDFGSADSFRLGSEVFLIGLALDI